MLDACRHLHMIRKPRADRDDTGMTKRCQRVVHMNRVRHEGIVAELIKCYGTGEFISRDLVGNNTTAYY